jgi:tryptophan-rich sensory protein
MRSPTDLLALVVCTLICFAAAAIGGIWTSRSVGTWYKELQKPSWNPPSWVFGPVWTALYLMMGISLWLVWRERAPALPLGLFALQLVLNAAWSGLFFGLRLPGAAFAEIVLLWLAILATVLTFRPIAPVAAVLLLPYLGWVSFASVLNFTIWRLNAGG